MKKLLIGIDGNEANIANRVGVNQYAYSLLWAIYKLQQTGEINHSVNIYLKSEPLADLPKHTSRWKYVVLPGKGMWIIKVLMPYLLFKSPKPDVFFTPNHYTVPVASIPRVVAIMDLGYLDSSGQFTLYDYWQLRLWTAWSIKVSKYLISISEATKKHIVEKYPFAAKKIVTTLLAYDSDKFNANISHKAIARVRTRYSTGNKYVLFLSTLKPSKNIEGLLTAWRNVTAEVPDYKLVITGKKGWMYKQIFDQVKALSIEDSVIFTDFIPEDDKAPLVAGARLFVLPSFWEGFGLDVLNAMACGVPVVSSNRGSLPEAGGDAALYIDPGDTDQIAKTIIKVLKMDKKQYNKLVKASLSNVKRFSWEKTALETLRVIEKMS